MKKLSIILLVLAFAASFVSVALAGDMSVRGYFTLDGEKVDGMDRGQIPGGKNFNKDTSEAWFDNEVKLYFTFTEGDVTAHWRMEVSDTEGLSSATGTGGNIVDDYWVKWQINDSFAFKTGEYFHGWGLDIANDVFGGYNLELMWGNDTMDVSAAIMKKAEADTTTGAGSYEDADTDIISLDVDFKSVGPFTKLAAHYAMGDDEVTDESATLMGLEWGVPIGPVSWMGEYGAFGGDFDGDYIYTELGFDDLVGLGLTLGYFSSSEDLADQYEEDWQPFQILLDDVSAASATVGNTNNANATIIFVGGNHNFTDKLNVGLKYATADFTKTPAGLDDAVGTEIDVTASYKLADNITYKAAVGSFSPGDGLAGVVDDSLTKIWNRITFTF
ncbi:hypothetical protein MUP29_08320 [bacterium]|nr:hypothetical protein [bacterium]